MTETAKPVATLPGEPGAVHSQNQPQHQGDGSPKSRWWVWVLLAIGGLGGIVIYRQRQAANDAKVKAAPPVRGVPIQVAKAVKGDIGEYVVALGTVTPVYTVTVTSRVLGEIIKVHYTEGQLVHKGEPLLDIDPRPYEAAVTQAEGQLARDQALLSEARIDYERYKAALARNAIAQQQVADQEQVVHQDEGTVKNDDGTLENAKVNLAYTRIVSPIDGRVGLRLVDPGNIVQANSTTPLVVITQLQPITIVFSVAEDYLSQLQPLSRGGRRMLVDAFDRQQQTKLATGYLLTVDNEVDTTTGTVKLKAQFDNRDGALFPNQFVNARLLLRTLKDTTLVPAQAVQQGGQGAFVYLIQPDETASMQPVKPITSDGNVTAIEGVQPGVTVAAAGFDKLQDGAKVMIRPGPEQSGNGAAAGEQGRSQGATRGRGPIQTEGPGAANKRSRPGSALHGGSNHP